MGACFVRAAPNRRLLCYYLAGDASRSAGCQKPRLRIADDRTRLDAPSKISISGAALNNGGLEFLYDAEAGPDL